MRRGIDFMTKKQLREYKTGNQKRREHLIALYYKVKPSTRGWIPLKCLIQKGKYASVP